MQETKTEEKEQIVEIKTRKIPLLRADQIECRIGTIKANGCSLLLYKTARTDMEVLDEVFGANNWQRDHKELKDNLYCGISIRDNNGGWVTKWDCGTESYTEKEKGEASDSFKRAGFNVGIGRELYTAPFIWIIPRKDMNPKGKESEFYEYKKDAYTTKTVFTVTKIGYDDQDKINELVIADNKGNTRFELNLAQEYKDKWFDAMNIVEKLLDETETDREKFYEHFGNSTLTQDQLLDAIILLNKKRNKKNIKKLGDIK